MLPSPSSLCRCTFSGCRRDAPGSDGKRVTLAPGPARHNVSLETGGASRSFRLIRAAIPRILSLSVRLSICLCVCCGGELLRTYRASLLPAVSLSPTGRCTYIPAPSQERTACNETRVSVFVHAVYTYIICREIPLTLARACIIFALCAACSAL